MKSISFVFYLSNLILIDFSLKLLVFFFGPDIKSASEINLKNFIAPSFHELNTNIIFIMLLASIVQIILVFISFSNIKINALKLLKDPPMILIMAGTLSNTLEGVVFNRVLDFFLLETTEYYLIFNMADLFIWIGIVWLLINSLTFIVSLFTNNSKKVLN